MTYNVFGGTLNLAQQYSPTERNLRPRLHQFEFCVPRSTTRQDYISTTTTYR